MTHRLIILRHGKRHIGTDELHSEGLIQSELRAKFFSLSLQNESVQFVSSPKKRCIQTLSLIAEACGKSFTIDSALEERRPNEDSRSFIERIKKFLSSVDLSKEASNTLFICSHSDWIFEAARLLGDLRIHLEEAGWCEFKHEDNVWILTELVSYEKEFQNLQNSFNKNQ